MWPEIIPIPMVKYGDHSAEESEEAKAICVNF
jgi:hypothetical protein